MGCTIDELNDQKQMAVQVWNSSNVLIQLKNNMRLGQAECLSTVMSYALDATAAYALQTNSDLLKARPLTKWSDIKTREQLYTRLEADLGFDAKDHSLSVEQRKALVRAFADHRNALALDYDELGHVKGVKFRIPTGDAPPVKSKCRPLPPHLQSVLAEQIKRWLAQKVIKPCDGPWAAPLVPTPKKNGGWHFAVDYRGLNAITQTDARPVANLEDQLAKVRNGSLKKMKYFASLDLSEAYHCVDVAEEDQPKTAMITPKGLYSFNKMAFGLKSAPQSFHQIVQMIEKSMHEADPELAKTVLLYFDDCLLVAETFEELLAKLELFLATIEKIGLRVQPRKCLFCKQRIKWLGHVLTEEGIQPDPDRIKPLIEWETPQTIGDVRSLHGLLGTMRKFIKNFADKTKHIRKHLKPKDPDVNNKKLKKNKNQLIQWDKESQEELDHLVKLLTSAPILGHPDFSKDARPFIVTVDTSSTGIGATLSQEQKEESGKIRERVMAYCSRKLSDWERSYSAYKLELCGLVTALEHFRYFLIARKFKIRTDHLALRWLMKPRHNQVLPALLWRWHQWIAEYQYEIEWVSASKMKVADALSRKRYKEGDFGTMDPPMPKRDPLWKEDADLKEARTREDSGIESDDNLDAALLDKTSYVCSVDLGYESDEFENEERDDAVCTNNITYPGTCFALTRSQTLMEQSLPEEGAPEENQPDANQMEQKKEHNTIDVQMDPSDPSSIVRVERAGLTEHGRKEQFIRHLQAMGVRCGERREEIDKFYAKWDQKREIDGTDEDPNDEDLALEEEYRILTGHKTAVDEDDIREEMKKGVFTYDTPTQVDVMQSVLKSAGNPVGYDDSTSGPFDVLVRKKQSRDTALKFVKDCLDQREAWPTNNMEIKRLIKRLYTFYWIGRENDEGAGPMPPIPDEAEDRTPEDTELQRAGDHHEQRKMRARMHDRQVMLKALCHGHINGEVIKRSRGIVQFNGKIVVPVGVDFHEKIIQAIHHSQGAFHLGINKTKIILDKYFWFNDMAEKIAKYLKGCKQCQDGKRLTFQLVPELGQTSSYSRERLRTWSMDVIQMPKGHNGYGYILTCLDVATSWLEAWPLKRATADKVSEIIEFQLVPRYGEGLAFIVDQGREFIAHVVKRAVHRTNSYIHYGTVYNSQSNPVEWFHRTLEGVIHCLLIDRQQNAKQWPLALQDALRTMRSAPDATTGLSPFFRVFGMQPRISAIERMNLKLEEGGFSFNPDPPP